MPRSIDSRGRASPVWNVSVGRLVELLAERDRPGPSTRDRVVGLDLEIGGDLVLGAVGRQVALIDRRDRRRCRHRLAGGVERDRRRERDRERRPRRPGRRRRSARACVTARVGRARTSERVRLVERRVAAGAGEPVARERVRRAGHELRRGLQRDVRGGVVGLRARARCRRARRSACSARRHPRHAPADRTRAADRRRAAASRCRRPTRPRPTSGRWMNANENLDGARAELAGERDLVARRRRERRGRLDHERLAILPEPLPRDRRRDRDRVGRGRLADHDSAAPPGGRA